MGDRTGTYTGDLVDGLPDGVGKFVAKNLLGEVWTYEGEFVQGHFEDEGVTTWETGQIELGTYKNDETVPMSEEKAANLFNSPKECVGKHVDRY